MIVTARSSASFEGPASYISARKSIRVSVIIWRERPKVRQFVPVASGVRHALREIDLPPRPRGLAGRPRLLLRAVPGDVQAEPGQPGGVLGRNRKTVLLGNPGGPRQVLRLQFRCDEGADLHEMARWGHHERLLQPPGQEREERERG